MKLAQNVCFWGQWRPTEAGTLLFGPDPWLLWLFEPFSVIKVHDPKMHSPYSHSPYKVYTVQCMMPRDCQPCRFYFFEEEYEYIFKWKIGCSSNQKKVSIHISQLNKYFLLSLDSLEEVRLSHRVSARSWGSNLVSVRVIPGSWWHLPCHVMSVWCHVMSRDVSVMTCDVSVG